MRDAMPIGGVLMLSLVLARSAGAADAAEKGNAASVLVKEGKATAIIAVSAETNKYEQMAAKELVDYVEKMSGVRLEIATVQTGKTEDLARDAKARGQCLVLLGKPALPLLEKDLGSSAATRGAFALKARWTPPARSSLDATSSSFASPT